MNERAHQTIKHSPQPQSPVLVADVYLNRLCNQPLLFPRALEETNVDIATTQRNSQGKTPGQLTA